MKLGVGAIEVEQLGSDPHLMREFIEVDADEKWDIFVDFIGEISDPNFFW